MLKAMAVIYFGGPKVRETFGVFETNRSVTFKRTCDGENNPVHNDPQSRAVPGTVERRGRLRFYEALRLN
jgi:hypothetical protein